MSGLENLNTRLKYRGVNAEGRLQNDKLHGLKKALLYSYQAETAVLADEREFRCLISPNKETGDYDNKILSMPYEDICLNQTPGENGKMSEAIQKTNIKCGDVITWKETNTHWLVYLQYLEEDAYFRAQIRKCEQQTKIGDKEYWTYIRGPVETSIPWTQKGQVEWNTMNYSLVMYVTRDENTLANLHRFTKLKVREPVTNKLKTWEVVGVNPYWGDGIIEFYLDEDFENTIQDQVDIENSQPSTPTVHPQGQPYIDGNNKVVAYTTEKYEIKNSQGGEWFIGDKSFGTASSVQLDFYKRGKVTLQYKVNNAVAASLEIDIAAF